VQSKRQKVVSKMRPRPPLSSARNTEESSQEVRLLEVESFLWTPATLRVVTGQKQNIYKARFVRQGCMFANYQKLRCHPLKEDFVSLAQIYPGLICCLIEREKGRCKRGAGPRKRDACLHQGTRRMLGFKVKNNAYGIMWH
jgi:hypothetical protein